MRRLAFIALLGLLPVLAAQQDPDAERVAALIADLASQDWETRERASRNLVGHGEKARKPLRDALAHDDPEVRVRASAALIKIGEEFAYAVECAQGENPHLNEHGRAALMSLFRINDSTVLRELTQQELQVRRPNYTRGMTILKPPVLALAQLTATSGRAIVVSRQAAESFKQVLAKPQLNIQVSGDATQTIYVRDGLNRAFQGALGNPPPDRALVARPMRLGQAVFLYVTPATGSSSRCGRELIEDLLADDERRVVAAALLAEGAAGDTEAVARIRREYHANPGIERLMWLALALGNDARTGELAAQADAAPAIALLACGNWTALDMAARFMACLAPDKRGSLLSPLIESGVDAIMLSCALWMAKDAPLSEAARARAVRLLASRQDSLAASAARWLAGAGELTDEELEAVWKGAEHLPTDSAFFRATLEIVSRPAVAERLTVAARAALLTARPTQQALAAEVLKGRAEPADVQAAIEKLVGASNDPLLARQLIGLLHGAESLTDAASQKLVTSLTDANGVIRAVYLRALRALGGDLRKAVCGKVLAALLELAGKPVDAADPWKDAPVYVVAARISMLGLQAAMGDARALDQISAFVDGGGGKENAGNIEHAKAAGAAIVDALSGDALFQTLDDWKSRAGVAQGAIAALEGYLEICRRSADAVDRATFRRAFAAAVTINAPNSWQIRNELMRLQTELAATEQDPASQRFPKGLTLNQRDSDVK